MIKVNIKNRREEGDKQEIESRSNFRQDSEGDNESAMALDPHRILPSIKPKRKTILLGVAVTPKGRALPFLEALVPF